MHRFAVLGLPYQILTVSLGMVAAGRYDFAKDGRTLYRRPDSPGPLPPPLCCWSSSPASADYSGCGLMGWPERSGALGYLGEYDLVRSLHL